LQGKINQDLNLSAESASFQPNSMVGGNLKARLAEGRLMSDAAVIGGTKDISFIKAEKKAAPKFQGKFDRIGQALTTAMIIKWLMSLLIGIISGSVLLYFFGKTAQRLANQVKTSAVGSLGWGLVTLIVTPILGILLMATILGLPLGAMVFLGYILALITARWVTSYALGQWLEAKTKLKALKNPYVQLAAGLTLIKLVCLVPVLGWLVACAAMLMGLGALFVAFKTELNHTGLAKK